MYHKDRMKQKEEQERKFNEERKKRNQTFMERKGISLKKPKVEKQEQEIPPIHPEPSTKIIEIVPKAPKAPKAEVEPPSNPKQKLYPHQKELRKNLLNWFSMKLESNWRNQSGELLMIVGKPQCGKTFFLNRFISKINQRKQSNNSKSLSFLMKILDELPSQLFSSNPTEQDQYFKQIANQFLERKLFQNLKQTCIPITIMENYDSYFSCIDEESSNHQEILCNLLIRSFDTIRLEITKSTLAKKNSFFVGVLVCSCDPLVFQEIVIKRHSSLSSILTRNVFYLTKIQPSTLPSTFLTNLTSPVHHVFDEENLFAILDFIALKQFCQSKYESENSSMNDIVKFYDCVSESETFDSDERFEYLSRRLSQLSHLKSQLVNVFSVVLEKLSKYEAKEAFIDRLYRDHRWPIYCFKLKMLLTDPLIYDYIYGDRNRFEHKEILNYLNSSPLGDLIMR